MGRGRKNRCARERGRETMTDKFSTTPVEFRGIWIAVTAKIEKSSRHLLAHCSFSLGSSSQFFARNDKNLGIEIRFSFTSRAAVHRNRAPFPERNLKIGQAKGRGGGSKEGGRDRGGEIALEVGERSQSDLRAGAYHDRLCDN